MGIFTALTTAVGGLNSQAFALEQISGNIANSQTTGFKRTDVSFQDLVTESSANRQDAASVRVFSRPTNDIQGDIAGSSVPTYMAIAGDGYFIAGQRTDTIDNRAVFSDVDLYTRRGDFERDAEGYLRNGAGYYLKGIELVGGNPATGNPSLVQVNNDPLPANPTTRVEYRANLPTFPLNENTDTAVPGSELLTAGAFVNNPLSTGLGGTGIVNANEADEFIESSISGGAFTGYTANGSDVNVQMRWAKTSNTLGSENWNLFYLADSASTGANPAWQNTNQDFVFDAGGVLTSPASNEISIANLTVNGTSLGAISIDFGNNGLTQFDDADGAVNVTDLQQDGFPAGDFSSVTISDSGRVVANYTNGENVEVADITLATFSADSRLQKLDGGAFAKTADSGDPAFTSTAQVISNALESSNTEIADEFTKLIITQQAYSANSRIITTADEMIDEVLNIVR